MKTESEMLMCQETAALPLMAFVQCTRADTAVDRYTTGLQTVNYMYVTQPRSPQGKE